MKQSVVLLHCNVKKVLYKLVDSPSVHIQHLCTIWTKRITAHSRRVLLCAFAEKRKSALSLCDTGVVDRREEKRNVVFLWDKAVF